MNDPVRILKLPTFSLPATAVLIALLAGCLKPVEKHEKAASTEPVSSLPAKDAISPGAEMVLVSGGEFLMGSSSAVDAGPVHKVMLSDFYMDCREVTQELYEKIMGRNPSRRKGQSNPVERVRWSDAIKFCNARSEAEGLQPCYDLATRECNFEPDGYRLPTEAEWEYACRGGSKGDYYFGDDPAKLESHAWFKANSRRRTHPAAEKPANPLGLYDMAGNVWEWCNDWYRVDYYAQSPATDPRGPREGEKKSLRGGAFSSSAESCSSWTRYCDEPGFTDACVASDDYGFRCVRRAPRR
ncbi:MAG: SUMF1/EgtB/PvdO family nonheme iron enzyme [Pirellulales bacterium]|nr:SUMF1/EgtB/PvdO family nonheme iron enzyme [Pirellulales bacterium]